MALWKAAQAEVKVDLASNVTITTAAALDTFFGATASTISGYMKDVTVVVPEGDLELLKFIGVTSSLQNTELDQQAFDLAELSGTLVLGHDEVLMGDIGGTPTHLFFGQPEAISTTHSRYQPGKLTTAGAFERPESAWLINITDGTDEVNIVLDNALVTQYGDIELSDGDAHFEVSVTVKCRPNDFYMEWKD